MVASRLRPRAPTVSLPQGFEELGLLRGLSQQPGLLAERVKGAIRTSIRGPSNPLIEVTCTSLLAAPARRVA